MGVPDEEHDASATPATTTTSSDATAAAAGSTITAPTAAADLPPLQPQPPLIREQAASPSPVPSPPPLRSTSQSRGAAAAFGEEYRLPKNKSTGNLLAHGSSARTVAIPDVGRQRFSFDASAFESMSKSPIIPEHEHGLGASGLRRIRQQPHARLPGIQTGSTATTAANSRSTSMNFSLPPTRHPSTSLPSGPGSPTLNFSEDLTRFPSESLHSFSFAHQSEDFIHNRQTVLKRSIDFMRDKLGWAGSNPGIATAQARLSGDQEVLSMMELLSRAHLLENEASGVGSGWGGLGQGLITGPADVSGENVFEKGFMDAPEKTESPVDLQSEKKLPDTDEIPPDSHTAMTDDLLEDAEIERRLSTITSESPNEKSGPPRPTRASLKRTLTDTAPLDIQSKLTDALAKPYSTNEVIQDHPILSPTIVASVPRALPTGPSAIAGAPHGHAQRWAPAAQAIFTTEAHAPWTITAANDLACLVFGVTKAEVRRLGILEVVREERRKWLEEKLKDPDSGSSRKGAAGLYSHSQRTSPNPTTTLNVGNGVTARLLNKPNSRSQPKKRAKTDDGSGSTYAKKGNNKAAQHHHANKSRGVLLCGDVVPIQKRNGAVGSASLWVKEKRGGLIWVLEEIAEDVVYISLDEVGCVTNAHGAIEPIWGFERIRRGMDIVRLVPGIPRLPGTHTGALDYDEIAELRTFTASTSNNISIPITVEGVPGEPTFRISSFPHIAGIMVLNAGTLQITSSNSVFSAALFGQPKPDGLNIEELIPGFGRILQLMTDEDKIQLVDGIVIPEHSFRRARALLAMREGSKDAAAVFLRPAGLMAMHRDGAEIMVDVQMRVVKSEKKTEKIDEDVIVEDVEAEEEAAGSGILPQAEVVYALWITYSRQLHAASTGVGPLSPLTPAHAEHPKQPSPGQSTVVSQMNGAGESVSLLTQQLSQTVDVPEAAPSPSPVSEVKRSMASPAAQAESAAQQQQQQEDRKNKTINDFVVLEDMGQGAYGQVKLCRYKRDREKKMVIKYVTKRRILVDTWTRDRKLGTVPLEIHVLDFLRRPDYQHVNIVEMADFFEDEVNYYIEMVPHGLPGMDLFDYIELRVNMDEAECRKLFVQVARAVEHLHITAKVVHRDIKDENVILDGEGRVKLIDFGSAAYIKSGPFDVFVGTIDYAAPEVLRGLPYRGKEQDVWALGILLYTIIYKENPFYSIDEIMDHDLRVPYVLSEESIDLIRRMLDRDVEQRMTIGQVLEHPWCKGDGSGWNEATEKWEWPC